MNITLALISIISGIVAGEVLYRNFHGEELKKTVLICSVIVLGGVIASKLMNLYHSELILVVAFITVMSVLIYLTARIAWHLTKNNKDDWTSDQYD